MDDVVVSTIMDHVAEKVEKALQDKTSREFHLYKDTVRFRGVHQPNQRFFDYDKDNYIAVILLGGSLMVSCVNKPYSGVLCGQAVFELSDPDSIKQTVEKACEMYLLLVRECKKERT
jgi:archaeosine-15-forming tRNA-guanine transglycosylase